MQDDDRQAVPFLAGLAIGTLVGAGLALLLAPRSGKRTRRRIARAAEDLSESAKDRVDDTRADVKRAARDAVRAAERRGARLRETVRRAGRPRRD